MKTETTTTMIFTLPSGLDIRLTNGSPGDIEYLKGIETAVLAEREACAKVCDEGAAALNSMGERDGANGAMSCAGAIRMRSNA